MIASVANTIQKQLLEISIPLKDSNFAKNS